MDMELPILTKEDKKWAEEFKELSKKDVPGVDPSLPIAENDEPPPVVQLDT